MKKQIRIALPKGRLFAETAPLLQAAGWGFDGYSEDTRLYHLISSRYPELFAKVFNEKDIPVQVAIGNYDLGICGLDWVEEQLVKYPSSALVKVKELGYGEGALFMATSRLNSFKIEEIRNTTKTVRIVSEYPNLAESFAAKNRLRRFSIFPLWGAAEVYPPESADMALVAGGVDGESLYAELVAVEKVLNYGAVLIANRQSWESQNMGQFLTKLSEVKPRKIESASISRTKKPAAINVINNQLDNVIRIALPDGHQQAPTLELLQKAGIEIEHYQSYGGNRRPATNLKGAMVKVIRPQDMPLQVANGNFDLAITGRDWLKNHLYQFPSSPVIELLDLKSARVKIVAVVSNNLPVENMLELRKYCTGRLAPLRIASEYTNIADKYARDNHLGMYRIIPTWGATETFLPDDADLLIENTQTGKTLARHNLKIIDTLFESTGCLISNTSCWNSTPKKAQLSMILNRLSRAAVGE